MNITAKTVSEFVALIEESNNKICFYRGESEDYKDTKITASRLRKPFREQDYFMQIRKFYEMTFSSLTQNEEENFLAFAQHHGIATQLLDITENPLIALFMACDGECKGTDGFVYSFNDRKNNVFNITDSLKTLDWRNFSSHLTWQENEGIIVELYLYALKHYEALFCADCMVTAGKTMSNMLNYLGTLEEKDEFKHDILNNAKKSVLHCCKDLRDLLNQENHQVEDYTNNKNSTLQATIKKLFALYYPTSGFCLFEETRTRAPILLYTPLLSFDRAISQQSMFIFQWFESTGDKTNPQGIVPDATISIPAGSKDSILSTLDKLNINKATVYGDFDNIAKYITSQHGNVL